MSSKKAPLLYKGAGPGSHWHRNDARLVGFSSPSNVVASWNHVLSHITAYSQVSPLTSFSTSYAIARRYAQLGPLGPATAARPGYVYVIDLSQLGSASSVKLVDPVEALAQGTNGGFAHGHNCDISLIHEAARGVTPFSTPLGRFSHPIAAHVPPELLALVSALRDAEVLVAGSVPKGAVTDRDDVH